MRVPNGAAQRILVHVRINLALDHFPLKRVARARRTVINLDS